MHHQLLLGVCMPHGLLTHKQPLERFDCNAMDGKTTVQWDTIGGCNAFHALSFLIHEVMETETAPVEWNLLISYHLLICCNE